MAWRYHGKATVDPEHPRAFGVSDRSGFWVNHDELCFQWEWFGPRLGNKRILVPKNELDIPQEQLRPKPVPPDPTPIFNARPEPFSQDNQGVTIGQSVTPPDFQIPIYDE